MGDCLWKVIMKKTPQKVGGGGLNTDQKFYPWKKIASRENSQHSARENKTSSRENLSNTARENPGLPVKMFKKVGVKMNFHPWKKSKKEQKRAFKGTFDFHGEKKTLTSTHHQQKRYSKEKKGLYAVFFFSRENQKCPWKPFFALFSIFFTGGNSFSHPLFLTFLRVVQGFHGQYLINFPGRNFYFHGRNAENFHGRIFFFTGRILDQCYALNPPTPLFAAVFFIITLHDQSPIFKGHFFRQNYINLLPNFQGIFFRNLLSRRIF